MAFTPTPWKKFDKKNIGDATGWPIFTIGTQAIFSEPMHCDQLGSDEDDADRILSCVNACNGIQNPEAIKDALDGLQQAIDQLFSDYKRTSLDGHGALIKKLESAVLKLGRKK